MMEYFWAKTKTDKQPGKSVLSHMQDVRAVAYALQAGKEVFLSSYQMNRDMLACFAGLHDIGKISPGFQSKCFGWLKQNKLVDIARNYAWDTIHESDHSKITQYTIQNILQKNNMKTESAELWGALAGAHHGRLHQLGLVPKGCKSDDEWEKIREKTIGDFWGSVGLPHIGIDCSWPLAWWLAGFISVADWIGSNEDYCSPDIIETQPVESSKTAAKALKAIGFDRFVIKPNLSFGDVFQDENNQPFLPNDLQQKASDCIKEPGLYVIEAPMGMGKTEAALWCAYKLMCKGKASGIYFALPTQTTSNRIHERMQKYLAKILNTPVEARLIHANSWLMENIQVPTFSASTTEEKESAQDAKDWFASKKRALLAPFGVGTVDQALMSVIAVKHFFVRQFALSGKVVILDEVHSYDLYTGTLIKSLCKCLLPLGCTVIVLSATLTREGKKRFIDVGDGKKTKEAYPLIEGTTTGEQKAVHMPVEKPEIKRVSVVFKSESDALSVAAEKAKSGSSVLWVCDTVKRAQEMYQRVEQNNMFEKGILHARFPVFRRQELEDYWLEKLGKEGKGRSGCILFSTQVVEQSVDLDADFMISELAPTDMLLQRMGRLWRHPRAQRSCKRPEFCIVAETNSFDKFKKASAAEIKKMFGTKSAVYAPYVLLRSLERWKSIKIIDLPGDIRGLLEQTYKIRNHEPAGWQGLSKEILGDAFAKKNLAEFEANVWNPLLNDDEGTAKTRVSSYPVTQMILAKQKQGKKIILLNGEIAELDKDAVSLSSARSMHRNIVKIPSYCFRQGGEDRDISALVRGNWQLGFVDDNNILNTNLKKEYTLKYTSKKGVEIMRNETQSEVDYEPCD